MELIDTLNQGMRGEEKRDGIDSQGRGSRKKNKVVASKINSLIALNENLVPPEHGVKEAEKMVEISQGEDLDAKISKALDILGESCKEVELDSLIEVGNELVALAKDAKSNLSIENEGEMFEDWKNCPGSEEDDFPFEEGSCLKSRKRRKVSQIDLSEPGKLGINQKDMNKSSPNCGQRKKRGRIPNQEKAQMGCRSNWEKED